MLTSGKTWKGEFHNKKKDGTLYWESAIISPVYDNEGELISYLAVKQDITHQKEMEKELQFTLSNLESLVKERTVELEQARDKLEKSLQNEKELGELKTRFVSTASHQFRTPLTVIQANIGLLQMQMDSLTESDKKKYNKVCNRIESEVLRMTELMDDVLLIGKIKSKRIKLDIKPTNLVELAKDIISRHNEIQPDGRKMDLKVSGNQQSIHVDKKLITHSLSNVISNAFKYSVGKAAPICKVEFNDKHVVISVKDYGLGIPLEDMSSIFNSFHRASNVTDIGGTGLGMAIAKEYVELNDGKIKVNSGLNEGTEVIITLKNK